MADLLAVDKFAGVGVCAVADLQEIDPAGKAGSKIRAAIPAKLSLTFGQAISMPVFHQLPLEIENLHLQNRFLGELKIYLH